ncbi:MAG: C39 family peptidase [Candidatus Magasanikbacteria bacterium]|nr:C39 family peptidase [Candidatus Magasanikbacteria bacterium]
MRRFFLRMFLFLFLFVLFFAFFLKRVQLKHFFDLQYRKMTLPPAASLPPAVSLNVKNVEQKSVVSSSLSAVQSVANSAIKEKITSSFPTQDLPREINLAVPFVSQAPLKNWDAEHEETCEEAAVLMLGGFYQGIKKFTRQEMEDKLQEIIVWEKEKFGYFEDTTAEQTVQILREFFNLTGARVYYDFSIADIKKHLALGRPVIVPAAGKLLPNPYFRNGGPLYHMLVLKGYTKDGKFISNDPGTNTLGEDFTYKLEALFNAIHDWRVDKDILQGRRAMIVVENKAVE